MPRLKAARTNGWDMTDAQRRAAEKQKLKRKSVTLSLTHEQYDEIKKRAEEIGKKVHGYIISELFKDY